MDAKRMAGGGKLRSGACLGGGLEANASGSSTGPDSFWRGIEGV
jgi:hypothetical protein